MAKDHKVVLLVELAGGEVVAVPFASRERADWWEGLHSFETVGRPRLVSARSLSIGQRFAARSTEQKRE